jgi:hypothetical protein
MRLAEPVQHHCRCDWTTSGVGESRRHVRGQRCICERQPQLHGRYTQPEPSESRQRIRTHGAHQKPWWGLQRSRSRDHAHTSRSEGRGMKDSATHGSPGHLKQEMNPGMASDSEQYFASQHHSV